MPNRDGTVWWTPPPEDDEDDEDSDVDWIEHDPGAVPVGEIAADMAHDQGTGFLEAASHVMAALPPGYRTPKEGTR